MLSFRHYHLTVAIISNVQYVRLQRRHKPTDDASIRRWRGSQQTGPVPTLSVCLSVCLSFRLSIRHTRDLHFTLHDKAMFLVSSCQISLS